MDLLGRFPDAVVRQALDQGFCSDNYASFDGTTIESMASIESFRSNDEKPEEQDSNSFKPRNAEVAFHGQT